MRPRRASPNGTSERSSTRPPQYRASRSHTTSRGVAGRLQIAADDFVERRSFRAGDLDDAVSRRRERHLGDDRSNVVRRDGLEQAGRKPDDVSIRTWIGDAPEESNELGRTDNGVGDAGGFDQFLLGDLGAEIAIVAPVGSDDG